MIDPEFGQPLPVRASRETLEFLRTRRSASAVTLKAPGPDKDQLARLLKIAARVPDHGKLSPWRFIIIEGEAKAALVAKLESLAEGQKALAALDKLRLPPVSVAVVSKTTDAPIPEWEQILSAGAVCTVLLVAAGAMGFGANWITDWYSYDKRAKTHLGVAESERIAGFLHIGTAAEAPLERARPDLDGLIHWLQP